MDAHKIKEFYYDEPSEFDLKMPSPRTVKFIVGFVDYDRTMVESLGLPASGEIKHWPMRDSYKLTWEIPVSGQRNNDVSTMIETVLVEVEAMKLKLLQVFEHPNIVRYLSIVLHIEPDQHVEVGPGFGLNSQQIHLLCELGATLDVDLFGVEFDEEIWGAQRGTS